MGIRSADRGNDPRKRTLSTAKGKIVVVSGSVIEDNSGAPIESAAVFDDWEH